jgi:hypothetical protein
LSLLRLGLGQPLPALLVEHFFDDAHLSSSHQHV